MSYLSFASFFLLSLSRMLMTVPSATAVQPDCNPFNSVSITQSNCPLSSLEYCGNGSVLTLAALLNLECTLPVSSIRVSFDDTVVPKVDSESDQWTFSYSIMWTDVATNCVVDVTSTITDFSSGNFPSYPLPNDTNGYDNDPMTNISTHALNQWYTRSFTINGSSLSSFRYGFTCAASTSDSTNNHKVVYIKDISWTSSAASDTIYNSLQSCVGTSTNSHLLRTKIGLDCPRTSIEGAYCQQFEDGYKWVYYGDMDVNTLEVDGPLVVYGNVAAKFFNVHELLDVRGCITLSSQNYVSSSIYVKGYSESTIVIRQNDSCPWPRYTLHFDYDKAITDEKYPILCPESGAVYPNPSPTYDLNVTNGTMVVAVPYKLYTCYPDIRTWIAGPIVGSVVVVAGVIIGIVFGVRCHRQRTRAQQLDQKMEGQTNTAQMTADINPKVAL